MTAIQNHLIPQEWGGPQAWWNIHPVPIQGHQGGVHGKGAPLRESYEGYTSVMSGKYAYLKPYVGPKSQDGNWFLAETEPEIQDAEKKLNLPFPPQLREFYLEIGAGFLARGNQPPFTKRHFIDNHILAPSQIVDMTLNGPESGMVLQCMWECFQPENLYFFDILGEGEDFFMMKPLSKNPNAVYETDGTLVEDSFERFIWRLYHESPTYYMTDWGK
jgi:hypothetical protein